MNIKMVGAAMLAGAMIVGCNKNESASSEGKSETKEDVMAVSVNGEKLMQSSIDADVDMIIKAQGARISPEQMNDAKAAIANQLVQSFIIENVLLAKAKEGGFTVSDEDRKAREEEFLKNMSRMPDAPKTMEEHFKKFPLGEKRAREEFENGLLIDKMMKAEHANADKKDYAAEAQKIITNIESNNTAALPKIKALKEQLDKFADNAVGLTNEFAKLARENSACPSGQPKDPSKTPGDLGEFTHGQMVKEFDEVAFALPVGKVSDPVKTGFGYHLILVTKKTPAVEAKGDKPAEPEKVQASHILLKVQDVPKQEELAKHMERQDERGFMQGFVMKQLKAAKLEASEAYKQFLPPTDEPKAAVENPTEK